MNWAEIEIGIVDTRRQMANTLIKLAFEQQENWSCDTNCRQCLVKANSVVLEFHQFSIAVRPGIVSVNRNEVHPTLKQTRFQNGMHTIHLLT